MFLALFILNILTISYAQSYGISPKNVITVPPNCPPGQEWINGSCRDIWFMSAMNLAPLNGQIPEIAPINIITVPPNCPPGQQYINGQCRDVWRRGNLANSLIYNQQLEKLWSDHIRKILKTKVGVEENSNVVVNDSPRHIINVPNQCPIGFRPDALGICRRIL